MTKDRIEDFPPPPTASAKTAEEYQNLLSQGKDSDSFPLIPVLVVGAIFAVSVLAGIALIWSVLLSDNKSNAPQKVVNDAASRAPENERGQQANQSVFDRRRAELERAEERLRQERAAQTLREAAQRYE